MTTAKFPPRTADRHSGGSRAEAGTAWLGEWALRAGSGRVLGENAEAWIRRDGLQVPTGHDSPLLEEFLKAMGLLQADIVRRFEAIGSVGALSDRTPRDHRA